MHSYRFSGKYLYTSIPLSVTVMVSGVEPYANKYLKIYTRERGFVTLALSSQGRRSNVGFYSLPKQEEGLGVMRLLSIS